MTRGAKIGGAIAAVAGLGLISAVAFGVHALIDFNTGMRLGKEGYATMATGQYDRAIGQFDAALQKNLTSSWRAWIYLNRATACNHMWRLDDAIHDFTQALRFNPNGADAYAGRGWAYQQKGEIEKALSDLDEAIRRDRNSQSAYYNRGLIFYQKNETDRAIADFEESVRCNPNQADGFIMRGLCFAAKNDLDRALANFDAAISIEPNNAKAFTERGYLYERRGESGKSVHDLAEARRLAPSWSHPKPASHSHKTSSDFEREARLDVKPLPSLNTEAFSIPGKTSSELIGEARLAYDVGEFDRAIDLDNAAPGYEA